MSIEEKAKAYDEAIEKAKEIKEKIVYSHLSTESCKAVSEYIDTIIPELREKPLTPFQQCLNCILRGVYYAEVPDKKVNEFILNVVRTRTDELIKLTKKHEYTDCQLRENEDERIRKEIIDFLETIPISELKRVPRPISEWFAWLEKQKEHHIPWYDYQKSKEAGYTIVPNEEYEQLIKQKEQKSVQSNVEKEYVRTIKSLISDFIRGKREIDTGYYQKIYDWLDGRHVEPKPTWSEEDETAFGDLMWCIEQARKSAKDENDMGNIWFAENWVKNRLKPLRPQPKQEWSEKDETHLGWIIECFDSWKYQVPEFADQYQSAINWLKSLRPSWKPSKEQMEALQRAANKLAKTDVADSVRLSIMYDNLKKL